VLKLAEKKILVHGREVAGDVAFGDEERGMSGGEMSRNLVLAAVEAEAPETVGVGVCREAMVEASGEKTVEE